MNAPMNEPAVVFIVNVQPEQQDDGKYVPRFSVIRKNRRTYAPYLLEAIEEEGFFTALAAVEHGRLVVYELLHKRVPEAEIQFVDWKEGSNS